MLWVAISAQNGNILQNREAVLVSSVQNEVLL